MRITRALLLSSLVPLLAVGLIAVGLGYRSISDLVAFLLASSIVVYPFVVTLALGSHAASRWLGFRAPWQFALGGLLTGSILSILDDLLLRPAQGGTPVLETATGGAIFGAIGLATAVAYWHLAIRERAV